MTGAPGGGLAAVDMDRDTAAVVLKLDPNPFHHGSLSIVRSFGRVGVPVYLVVESAASPAAWSRYLRGRFVWNPTLDDVPALLAGLQDIARTIGGRPVLIPVDDLGAILVAEHADTLAASFRLPDQPAHLPRDLASKERLAEICRDLGVATPAVRPFASPGRLADIASDVSYPVVIKVAAPWKSAGRGGLKSTTIVWDEQELRALTGGFGPDTGPPILVQEYLPAEDCEDWFFHGHVARDPERGTVFRMSVTGRKLRSFPPTAGITTLGRAWDNPELRKVAENFLTEVGYQGIVDLDFRLDRRTGSFHLLDANPRPGAQFAIARRSDGIDAGQALHRELTGRPLTPQQEQARDHALCVETYDTASTIWSIAHRRLTPSAWRDSMRAGPVEWAWFALDDLLPWVLVWCRFPVRQITHRRPRERRRRHPRPILVGHRRAAWRAWLLRRSRA